MRMRFGKGMLTMLLFVAGGVLLWQAGWVPGDLVQAQEPAESPRAIIKTKFGEMEIRFYANRAPKHVDNFVSLAREGFYDGTLFHRVIPGFMIQGGDPYTKDPDKTQLYGTGGPGYNVDAEFNDISHTRGIVSMARAQDPNSAGSQFFIVVKDSPFLDRKYTVFGKVVRGMDVADKIVNQPRDVRDKPVERVEMDVDVEAGARPE